MIITINGQKNELKKSATITELLEQQGYSDMLVAVAHNGNFVPRETYNNVHIIENDDIEIVAPMQGG